MRGYPFFSTQIALMQGGELVLGVSSAPVYGETMWASAAAARGSMASACTWPTRARSTQASISTGNLKTLAGGARWDALGALIRDSNRIRGYGDFCTTTCSRAAAIDLVIESDLNILDIAPLALIVREAGGVFTDLDGAPLTLDTRSALAGTPALHAQALRAACRARPDRAVLTRRATMRDAQASHRPRHAGRRRRAVSCAPRKSISNSRTASGAPTSA